MAERGQRARVIAVAAIWATFTAAIAIACYPDNCIGDTVTYGAKPGEGRMLSADMWESSAIDGLWLPFPRQRVYVFEIDALNDRVPQTFQPYLSPIEQPLYGGFTPAGGNLSEISGVGKNRVVLKNSTCSDFYLRFVVTAVPAAPQDPDAGSLNPPVIDDGGTSDASTIDDAGATDASND